MTAGDGSLGARDAARVVAWLRAQRWPVAGLVVALLVVVIGKQAYRSASAAELGWILAPTARLVSAVSGTDFVYEAGIGWVDLGVTFIIAPACAGVNFAIAGFLALTLGWLGGMRSARSVAVRLAGAAALAYVATLVVNTVRIVIAIALHLGTIDLGGLDRAEVHRFEGIVVYLAGLCALYALAGSLLSRSSHAVAR